MQDTPQEPKITNAVHFRTGIFVEFSDGCSAFYDTHFLYRVRDENNNKSYAPGQDTDEEAPP